MSVFEFVLVFLTLVLGLGVTNNLTSIAELDFRGDRERARIVLAWLVSVTLLQIDFWFAIWTQKRDGTAWTIAELLLWLSVAAALFLAGAYFARSTRGDPREQRIARNAAVMALAVRELLVVVIASTTYALPIYFYAAFAIPLGVLLVARLSRSTTMDRVAAVAFLLSAVIWTGFIGPSEISDTIPVPFPVK